MGELIVSDSLAKIKEEIRVLKAEFAKLLQERDELVYHICPEFRAKYEAELFRKAAAAYEEGDILTLQAIYDEIYGLDTEAQFEEENMDDLINLRNQLQERIAKVMDEINTVKSEFPYTEKEFLDNPEAVKELQEAIIHLIEEYEKEILRLSEMLQEVNQKMDELQKEKREKAYERR